MKPIERGAKRWGHWSRSATGCPSSPRISRTDCPSSFRAKSSLVTSSDQAAMYQAFLIKVFIAFTVDLTRSQDHQVASWLRNARGVRGLNFLPNSSVAFTQTEPALAGHFSDRHRHSVRRERTQKLLPRGVSAFIAGRVRSPRLNQLEISHAARKRSTDYDKIRNLRTSARAGVACPPWGQGGGPGVACR